MHPAEITVEQEGTVLRIEWADRSISEISGRDLRDACDCSLCLSKRGDSGGRGMSLSLLSQNAARIRKLHLPSSSRLAVIWEDGHDDSLYRFADLIERFPPTGGDRTTNRPTSTDG